MHATNSYLFLQVHFLSFAYNNFKESIQFIYFMKKNLS